MPITAIEKWIGRRASAANDKASVEVGYLVFGTDDEAAAKAALAAAAPTTWAMDGVSLRRISVGVDQIAASVWEGVVGYDLPGSQPKQTGESTLTFDTSGGTNKITQSKQTVFAYAASTDSVPLLGGAINATADGVDGVDVTIPQFALTVTLYKADADVDSTYIGKLYSLTGKTNDADITLTVDGKSLTFLHGELLFLGAQGTRRGRGDWELSLKFAGSENATNITVGGITGIAKKGWEYLWVIYEKTVSGAGENKLATHHPKIVFIEKVYDEGDLTELGIPAS